jgi:hypothetical protein
METKAIEKKRAQAALAYIVTILEKYGFRWVITGGFACYVYGIDRLLTDIDIDIEVSKDTASFKAFYGEVAPYITQPLEHFVDTNYDNYNFELTYQGQVIDMCPMDDLKLFNKSSQRYESFYGGQFPEVEIVEFEGFELPLLSKQLVIKNKESLTEKDEWQQRDIDQLRKLL